MNGGVMSDLPAEVESWIGQRRYEENGEFDVERGYIFTSCSSVQNGNPLYWDEETANELTGGPIAPPSMISVWFRPHYWSPGRTEEAVAMQLHFDLKAALGLPEAVMTDNTITFHEPVRIGDRLKTVQILRSVSAFKTTKLGTGRFWVLDMEIGNQNGELCAIESYTGFGYNRS
ncbi:MAG: MaoC family dehydratase [bacterium]|nr:MaoC family dehydratase [bacterium]